MHVFKPVIISYIEFGCVMVKAFDLKALRLRTRYPCLSEDSHYADYIHHWSLSLKSVRLRCDGSSDRTPIVDPLICFSYQPVGFLYMHQPTDRIAHTMTFVTPVVEHRLEREIAQWRSTMKDRSDDPSHHERTLLPRSYSSLLNGRDIAMISHMWSSLTSDILRKINWH